jgi:RNA polymerase subunit RPABC4/transcription elongation factor Spt4
VAGLGYGWLALVAVAALAWYGIRTHHIRRMAQIEMREVELSGWAKLILARVEFAWQCPFCGMPGLTSEGVKVHLDPETSACAELQEARAANAAAADTEASGGRYDVSVSVGAQPSREDPWPALGAGEDDGGEA